MTHPDHETRVGAHSIFSMVLMPSKLDQKMKSDQISDVCIKQSGIRYSFKGALAGGKTVRDLN